MKIDIRNWKEFEDDFTQKEKIPRKKDRAKKKKDTYMKPEKDEEEDVLFR